MKINGVENRINGTLKKNGMEIWENCEVRVVNPIDMIIVITDITFKYSELVIIDSLKKQNPKINKSGINTLNIYETKRNNGN